MYKDIITNTNYNNNNNNSTYNNNSGNKNKNKNIGYNDKRNTINHSGDYGARNNHCTTTRHHLTDFGALRGCQRRRAACR